MKVYSIIINNVEETEVSLYEKSFSSHEKAKNMIPKIAKEWIDEQEWNSGENNWEYDSDLGSIVDNFGNVVIDFVVDYSEIN